MFPLRYGDRGQRRNKKRKKHDKWEEIQKQPVRGVCPLCDARPIRRAAPDRSKQKQVAGAAPLRRGTRVPLPPPRLPPHHQWAPIGQEPSARINLHFKLKKTSGIIVCWGWQRGCGAPDWRSDAELGGSGKPAEPQNVGETKPVMNTNKNKQA